MAIPSPRTTEKAEVPRVKQFSIFLINKVGALLDVVDGVLLTGFDQTPLIRQLLEKSRIPVVHMMELAQPESYCVGLNQFDAGHAMASHLDRALAAGCDDCATKPIDFEKLLQKIQSLLDRKLSTV